MPFGTVPEASMALKGNLRDFSVTQLLNLINLARKTGTLTLEGPNEAAWVSFHEGKLIYAQLGNEDATPDRESWPSPARSRHNRPRSSERRPATRATRNSACC